MLGYAVAQNLHGGEAVAEPLGDHLARHVEGMEVIARMAQQHALLADRTSANAVDAGDEIEKGADERREDDNADPADRRSHFLLRHRRMNGRRHPEHERKQEKHVGPVGLDQCQHDAKI